MEFAIPLVMRWLHILSATIAVGGMIFVGIVLHPAMAKGLAVDQVDAFRELMMKRWKLVFHPLILVFLVSGFYNYMMVTAPRHADDGGYHMMFGIKFLLALIFFALGIIATSTMKWSEKMRQGKGLWLAVMLAGIALVMIGGYMKSLPFTSNVVNGEVTLIAPSDGAKADPAT